jgi:hypothetical protein
MTREERQAGARLGMAAEALGTQLKIQLDMAREMARGQQVHTPGALGYCYGWCDAGLTNYSFNIRDRRNIGGPVLLQVFETLWPGQREGCLIYIFEHLGDSDVQNWAMVGGTEFWAWDAQTLQLPTGLIRCLRGAPQ